VAAVDGGEAPQRPDAAVEAAAAGAAAPVEQSGFDPEMRPQSTVEYARLGARIVDPRIIDTGGQVVNVLHSGQPYSYAYEVEFLETAFGVRFGMMVKLVTGFELGGQASHPWGRGLDVVEAGSRVRVRFRFQPMLAPGAYFLNAGVLGLSDQGEIYLHRILDALMFRVERDASSLATGQVDLCTSPGAELVVEAPRSTSERLA